MTITFAAILAMVLTLVPGSEAPAPSPEFMERIWGGQECLCGMRGCGWCGHQDECGDLDCEECYDIDGEWHAYEFEAYQEYAAVFTALFNSYEVKRAVTGRLMIRQGDKGRFKFAKMGG